MKIGILTFNWAINYGAVLQMYAEYKYLSKDNEVYVINYVPDYFDNMYNKKIFNTQIRFRTAIKRLMEKFIKFEQYKKFEKFIHENLILTEKAKDRDELSKIINKFDLVIVGSDQVWNYDITKDYIKDYLLYNFRCNKMSYAASLGKDEVKKELLDLFCKSLSDFDFVSLREKSSIDYVSKICKGKKYNLCIDPVFLISSNEWKKISENSNYNIPRKGYVLVYMLEHNSNLLKTARYLSKKYNIPVLSIEIPFIRFFGKNFGIKKLHDVGPIDFIKLFLHAKCILTNSFHGTAFSLIFHKPFVSFAHSKVNSRMESLLYLYQLKNVQIKNTLNNFEIVEKILKKTQMAYHNLENKEISRVIENSKQYLTKALEKIKLKIKEV
ncbi:polysaccharide pyruvyl transferase family protein [Thermosipho atlanticus]|uniref:Polysaccharide pyruvyl transferase n=1 Tax=Thermosipho atlanticus DSM 15807 TaxID=1123380 RepID=A0A1M5RM78_9BACT|nr:polysaccharide pyruvyl transferase family protein [Thermosipho atlanticus]SHH27138.1 Polysaccharide pyruvyl transferase [Thermosipho atlanticus DSM 15807]